MICMWCSVTLEVILSKLPQINLLTYFQLTEKKGIKNSRTRTLALNSSKRSKKVGSWGGCARVKETKKYSGQMQYVNSGWILVLKRKYEIYCCCCIAAKSYPTLWDLLDCSPPGSSVYGISQTKILEWVAISFSIKGKIASCKITYGAEV